MVILWYYSIIGIVRDKSLSNYIAYAQIFVYMNSIEKLINRFANGYIVNPTLQVTKAFRDQVENCLNEKFHSSTQSGIKRNEEGQ